MQQHRRATRLAALLPLIMAVLLLLPSALFAQDEPQVTWQSYDVTVQANEDGTLRVTESIVIDFNGAFGQGTRTIPMDRIESIDDVEVSVGTGSGDLTESTPINQTVLLEHGEFNARRTGDAFVINYGFDRTSMDSSDSIRTVVISYTAHGAIRVYPDAEPPEQQVRWTAISNEVTATGPVESASLSIVFPEDVPQERLAIDPDPTSVEADRVVWEREGLADGDSLQGAVAFPPITSATAPAWQADADTYEGRQENVPAMSLVLALLGIVVWVVTILLMMVRGVKDPEVGLVADIIPTRPDDLSAPLVGTLMDETVDTKDVLAGLLDLDRQGMIRIYEDSSRKKEETYRIELLRPIEDANEWDRPMLEGLFSDDAEVGKDVDMRKRMTELRQKSMSDISRAYENEIFERGYFVEKPATTRNRWIRNLLLLTLPFLLAVGALGWWAMTFSGWMVVPLVITGIGLIVGLILTTKAAVKTVEGAIVAAKWKAYGRYIDQLKKGPTPERFFEVLEADLPWAVALGFDSSWSKLADDVPPASSYDRRAGRQASTILVGNFGQGSTSASASTPSTGGSGSGGGGLQGASARTLAAIGGGSAGMFAMLNDAAAGFNEGASSGSSGGSSFSGSSSIGSSGGGGHSFS